VTENEKRLLKEVLEEIEAVKEFAEYAKQQGDYSKGMTDAYASGVMIGLTWAALIVEEKLKEGGDEN
jgi:hypothetical protein